MIEEVPPARIERWGALGDALGVDLFIARDDLLPFPLAGNKVRKLVAELSWLESARTAVITNGAIDSNHCRTVAWLAAQRGLRAHLVLHDERSQGAEAPGLRVLQALGATFSVVAPADIAAEIAVTRISLEADGHRVHTIPGGCHSQRGAIAYRDAAFQAFDSADFDSVFVASGTGATHGGIAAAAAQTGRNIHVVGVSVARTAERGTAAVAEAAAWAGSPSLDITFLDDFIAGGYANSAPELRKTVQLGWRYGLPLDETYTGKAMWALKEWAERGLLNGRRVLFWHTGGLWNGLTQMGSGGGGFDEL
ncbi:1-aminocyclopropane-1-carboxylate deaminase/D-cysteine desulfhydrase [Microbacterium alcoholitolerans]|uniref:1-aminocyclopropane-1-carboxylate deaminase/D-cysteine desulfhydrase n=1 Tax=unclassified Microbacterium TaxID=2609290 RepID=UPI003D17DE6C